MRIDILPNNASPAVDSGGTRSENGQVPDPGAFSAVIGRMTAPGANEHRERAEDFAPEVKQKDDRDSECTAAPISPFVSGPGSIRRDAESCGVPATPEAPAGHMRSEPEGIAGAGHRDGTPISADPDVTSVHYSADAADGALTDAAVPDGKSPVIANVTADQVLTMPPEETVFPMAPSVSSAAAAAEGLAAKNSEAQLGISSARPAAAPMMDSAAGAPGNEVGIAETVRNAETVEGVAARLTAIPVRPPALHENGGPEAPPQESQASGMVSPSRSSAASPAAEEAADAANLSARISGLDAAARSKSEGAPLAPDFSRIRVSAAAILPAGRRPQAEGKTGAVSAAEQPVADKIQASNEFAFAAGPATETHLKEPERTHATARQAGEKTAKEARGEQGGSAGDPVEPASAGTQSAQRIIFHSQFATLSASEAQVFAGFRPLPRAGSTTSTSWEPGWQLPQHAGGTDLKSILAQLAPKQSAPAQATDFWAALAGRIQMQLRENQSILTIQLKPSSLGRMEIKAETSAAGVLATILTESAGVKDYLEHNLPLLQQSFQDQGLKIDRINVALQDGSWAQQSATGHQESPSGSSRQGGSGLHSRSNESFGDPAEELVLDHQSQLALRPHSSFHAIA